MDSPARYIVIFSSEDIDLDQDLDLLAPAWDPDLDLEWDLDPDPVWDLVLDPEWDLDPVLRIVMKLVMVAMRKPLCPALEWDPDPDLEWDLALDPEWDPDLDPAWDLALDLL